MSLTAHPELVAEAVAAAAAADFGSAVVAAASAAALPIIVPESSPQAAAVAGSALAAARCRSLAAGVAVVLAAVDCCSHLELLPRVPPDHCRHFAPLQQVS